MIAVDYVLLPQDTRLGAGARHLNLEVVLRIALLRVDSHQNQDSEQMFSGQELAEYRFVPGSDGFAAADLAIRRLGGRYDIECEYDNVKKASDDPLRLLFCSWEDAVKPKDWRWAHYFMEYELKPMWDAAKAVGRTSQFYFCGKTMALLEVEDGQVIFRRNIRKPCKGFQWQALEPQPTLVHDQPFLYERPPILGTAPLQELEQMETGLPACQSEEESEAPTLSKGEMGIAARESDDQLSSDLGMDSDNDAIEPNATIHIRLPIWLQVLRNIYHQFKSLSMGAKILAASPMFVALVLSANTWKAVQAIEQNQKSESPYDQAILAPESNQHSPSVVEEHPSLYDFLHRYEERLESEEWLEHPGMPSPQAIHPMDDF